MKSALPRILIVFLLCSHVASGADETLPMVDGWPGVLILSGGSAVPDEAATALKDAIKTGGSLVLITEAASDPSTVAKSVKWLKEHEFSDYVTIDSALSESERRTKTIAAIDAASAVWIGGGQQAKLAKSFEDGSVESALQRLLLRGGTVGGTSAGAAIMSKVMIASGASEPTLAHGWDMLPGAIVDQHFGQRGRITRLQTAVAQHPECFGMGIDEKTAVFVKGREIRVVGQGSVSILLAKSDYRDSKVQQLQAGDSADLTQLRRASRQRVSRIDPGLPQHGNREAKSGALVIVGGGAMPKDVAERFIQLAGSKDANIVVLPTAVAREDAVQQAPVFLREANVKSITVLPQRGFDEVGREEFKSALNAATGIWFGGGRQWNFVDAYEGTEAVELFHDVLRRGGVIGGSSAGATILGEFLVRGHPLGNTVMMAEGYERGFALLPGAAIDQHFSQRERQPDLLPVIRRHPGMLGIGIDEGTAIVVTGTKVDVIGQHSAHFVSGPKLMNLTTNKPLPTTVDEAAKLYVSVKTGETVDLEAIAQ
jgi:cyanophycinase